MQIIVKLLPVLARIYIILDVIALVNRQSSDRENVYNIILMLLLHALHNEKLIIF